MAGTGTDEKTSSVSDPNGSAYDPDSPDYDVTADSSSPFYVGPISDENRSGDEIRSEVTAQVDEEIENEDNWLAKFIREITRDSQIQDRYSDQIGDQRSTDGLEMRPADGVPKTVWDNASHEDMVSAISDRADSAVVAESSEEWIAFGNDLGEHQRNLAAAIDDSMANWEGEGGDAARTHLADVGKWLGGTAQGAALSGRQQQIHSQSLNETQKQMAANPPVEFSVVEANARLQSTTDPVQFARQFLQDSETLAKQQAAREQAARLMTQYDESVGQAVGTPFFAAPPKLGTATTMRGTTAQVAGGGAGAAGDVQTRGVPANGPGTPADPALSPAETGRPLPGQPGSPEFEASHPSAPGSGPGGQGEPVAAQPFSSPTGAIPGGQEIPGGSPGPGGAPLVGGPDNNDKTNASGYQPPNIPIPGAPNIGPVPDIQHNPGSQIGNPPGGSTNPSGYVPPNRNIPQGPGGRLPPTGRISGDLNNPGLTKTDFGNPRSRPGGTDGIGGPRPPSIPGGTGGVPPFSGGRGGAAGGFGGLPGSGGGSAASGGAFGGGAAGAGGAGSASGAGATPGAGQPGAGGAGAANAAGGTGRGMGGAGMMGGGMGAGGAKPKEDDKEHRVANYLEADPELFDGGKVVAPPVIGDWKNQEKDKL